MNSFFGFAIQTLGATAVSMMVGYTWYSETLFGRLWWTHQFPGIAYGDMVSIKKSKALTLPPFASTIVTTICQNAILAFTIGVILPLFAAHSPGCTGLRFPLTFGAIVSGMCACVSFPHYAYARKPVVLYLIGTGHNTLQIYCAIFVIYTLALANGV